jgi:hypothetical protein
MIINIDWAKVLLVSSALSLAWLLAGCNTAETVKSPTTAELSITINQNQTASVTLTPQDRVVAAEIFTSES